MQEIVWGLDIGGTKCALCAADKDGRILNRHQIATASEPTWDTLLEALMRWGAGRWTAPGG